MLCSHPSFLKRKMNIMRLTEEQWMDMLLVLKSYRSDLASTMDEDAVEYINFIDNLVDSIQEENTVIEFTLFEEGDDEEIDK